VRWIVVFDAAALFAYDDARIRAYADVLDAVPPAGDPATALAALAAQIPPAAPAFIVYTSGTTGNPKGALVAHGRHLAAAYNMVEHYPTLAAAPHRTVVYLPLCHVLGRNVAITLPLASRLVPHFGEDLDDLPRTLFEVAPTVLFAVPRYLQKFASQVLVGISATSGIKRAAYEAAVRVGRVHARARWTRGTGGLGLAYALARATVFRPVLNKLGLDALELVLCGGAALPPETMALWHIWGVNVCEIYGQTETAGGIIAGQRGPFPHPGDVGTVPDGWTVRLGAEDEILVRVHEPITVSVDTTQEFLPSALSALGTWGHELVDAPDADHVRVQVPVTNTEALVVRLVELGTRVRLVGPEPVREALRARLIGVGGAR